MLTRTIAQLMSLTLLAVACSPAADPSTDGPADHSADPSDVPDQADAATDQATDPSTDSDAPAIQLVTDLDDDDAEAVGQAVNAFGFDLLAELTDGSETTVTSPLSVATMLAMVLAGAGGDTAEEMAAVLHIDDARDARVGALLDRLVDTDDVTLEVANALWSADGVPFETPYQQFVQDTFDATVEQADLAQQATADEIDAWVEEQTRGLIDGIAADLGLPDPMAILILLNAVYFLGEWTTQFDPDRTNPRPFTLADGSTADVDMMSMSDASFALAEGEGFRMLRLPYGDSGRYAMEVMLPDGDLPTMLGGLDAEAWAALVGGLRQVTFDEVALPTFELEWEAPLTDPLSAMGMPGVFSPETADLRPMTPVEAYLSAVVHKTYIRVDEEGTEAAAVTGGAIGTTAVQEPVVFQVDRSFAFTISDSETGTILFLGTVTDPRG